MARAQRADWNGMDILKRNEAETGEEALSIPEKTVELLAVPIVEWMNDRGDRLQFDFDVVVYDNALDEDRFLHEITVAIAVATIAKTGAKVTQLFNDLKGWLAKK